MPKVLLGDVAGERKETCKGSKAGYPIVGLEHLTPEEITLTSWSEDSDNTFTKMFHKGDVLFGRRRAYLKKAAVAPFDGICSGDITVLEAKAEKILPELLPFVIQNDSLFDFAVGKSAGSLSPRVKWEHLKNYEFELPDMEKQRELAELLWAMDEAKKAYRQLLAATDELVKSQFVEMFGDPDTVIATAQNTVSDIADVQVGLVIKPTRFYASNGIGTPAFRSLNVSSMMINDSDWVYFTDKGMKENPRTIAHTGDVLVVRSGYPGTSCVVTPEYDGRNVIDLLIAHPKREKMLPEFLCAFTNYPHGKMQIESMQRGIAQKHFNVSFYNSMKIVVPPLEAQQIFINLLKQSDKSKFALEQALAELTATYKSIIAANLG
ncbi:MAG: restriction endonuclease subunit S [bacterium]|nr:restriction endonuclease subunit S [bacterium]